MPVVVHHYIGAEILLPRGHEMARGHVVVQSLDAIKNIKGRAHTNSVLDTRIYQVEFTGGKVTELITIVIVKSMYTKCNVDGNECLFLHVLVDYGNDNKAISFTDKQTSSWGRPVTHKTNAGGQVCNQWKDGSTSWEKLFQLNESHPVQTAEFAVAQGIDHKPAFNCW